MKKTIIMAFVLASISPSLVRAQENNKGFYIKPYASYFFSVTPVEYPSIGGLPSRDRVFSINPVTGQQSTQSEDIMKGSFGAGYRLGLTGGYRFNDILGVELALNYYKSDVQDMSRQQATFTGTNATALSLEATGQARAYDIAPALAFFIPTKSEVFKPYAKVGIIIPLGGYSENITKITDNTGNVAISQGLFPNALRNQVIQQAEQAYAAAGMTDHNPVNPVMLLADVERVDRTKSNPTVGFQSALGADFWLSKMVAINVELEYRNVTVASNRRDMQSVSGTYTIIDRGNNHPQTGAPFPLGEGNLSIEAASESSKRINYHDHINVNEHNIVASGEFDPNQPADEVSNRLTFGGLGVSLGVKIFLGR
ncbi:outer membrane beta-barrel protein [Olivibacter sp. SDN3]|uniref:outer membrane beta-barrel protein n=1 Tax=Olivibacter sp. SDN3 TaxID=2764720 RepID=UPI001651A384|nr:outer membrane beta-barrel protein [Olivibacter sp. SDN3]QNL47721.1 outer membrane beta-barrel protein [Olivibacter sp. SDN3]